MKKTTILLNAFIVAAFLFLSCNNAEPEAKDHLTDTLHSETKKNKTENQIQADTMSYYMPESVNDTLAAKIADYIKTNLFTKSDDLNAFGEGGRKFQLYQIDLNEDGKKEIFINLMGPFFCGTGGCTLLLLDENLKRITKFTVTSAPVYAEQIKKNGWKILLVRSGGEMKELVYSKGTYPSNPSILKTTSLAPSGHATVMFDDTFSKAKTYSF